MGPSNFKRAEAASRLLKDSDRRRHGAGFLQQPGGAGAVRDGDQPRAQKHPRLQIRMGIHSGPVSEVVDVNERANIAGAGINMRNE